MNPTWLQLLQCPFCGGDFAFRPENDWAGEWMGVLTCACSDYPVIAGIPVMMQQYPASTALEMLVAGDAAQAFFTMLGVDDEAQQEAFKQLLRDTLTYRAAVEFLCHDAEGTYFFYRFSDPTFLASQAIVRAVSSVTNNGRALDVCGGAGHLTRVLSNSANYDEVWLADECFWKLWLARRILAPTCVPICCDANNPLPFRENTFSLTVCSDAFHYVWSKRLLATEMLRVTDDAGVVLLPHLHNALQENFSAGMPLTPAHYRSLFAVHETRLFRERSIFSQFIQHEPIDLARQETDEDLVAEPALSLLATKRADVFRQFILPAPLSGPLSVNPLYALTEDEQDVKLTLRFPSPAYAEEYAALREYLPAQLTIQAEALRQLARGELHPVHHELRQRFVLLDLPQGYC